MKICFTSVVEQSPVIRLNLVLTAVAVCSFHVFIIEEVMIVKLDSYVFEQLVVQTNKDTVVVVCGSLAACKHTRSGIELAVISVHIPAQHRQPLVKMVGSKEVSALLVNKLDAVNL